MHLILFYFEISSNLFQLKLLDFSPINLYFMQILMIWKIRQRNKKKTVKLVYHRHIDFISREI